MPQSVEITHIPLQAKQSDETLNSQISDLISANFQYFLCLILIHWQNKGNKRNCVLINNPRPQTKSKLSECVWTAKKLIYFIVLCCNNYAWYNHFTFVAWTKGLSDAAGKLWTSNPPTTKTVHHKHGSKRWFAGVWLENVPWVLPRGLVFVICAWYLIYYVWVCIMM